MRILLVEDDILIAKSLAQALMSQHYVVDIAADGQEGWEAATLANYDLLVLDVVMPKLNGFELCRRLRSQGTQTPILMLTTRDTSTDHIIGLDAGADDYVAKPFDLPELLARIRALLRRNRTALIPQLEWEHLQLDPNTCQVRYQGKLLHLTPKEYGLLELLLRNPQRIFSCSTLIDHLWSFEDPPTEETVRSHVKGVRQKLKTAGAPDPIKTVYGMGYRLKPAKKSEPIQAPPDDHLEAEVAEVWAKVQSQLGDRVSVIEAAIAELSLGQFTPELQHHAQREAHKLAGSLGMFGSDHGSRLAKTIEPLLTNAANLDPPQQILLSQSVMALRQEVQQSKTDISTKIESSDESDARATDATVLIVDDDPIVLNVLHTLLNPWGLNVVTLDQPRNFLNVLTTAQPDLLVLDVEMPDVTGIELCQIVRDHPQWSHLPILFLTAHTDADTLHQVFSAGADDFVSKPIVGPELVTRILNRLERSRLLQNLSDIDPLTGVPNRRKSTQRLKQLLENPDRHPMCLAILTLHNLKTINRDYGHAAGDQVLSEVGELLRQLFPKPAVVGHWGGTEFVIGMTRTTKPIALQRLNQLLEKQQQQSSLKSGRMPFQIMGRIRVAQAPDEGTDLRSLYQAAERHQASVTEPSQIPNLNPREP
jgi:diguanylate cyclase (GGDEF)-like protein